MARFYLVRHGYTDMVDRAIAGRMPGIHLNGRGREQAARLAECMGGVSLDRICASPLERAVETAAYLAEPRGMDIRVCEEFNEIDFGDWTGSVVSALAGERWECFNSFRSGTRIPNGEMMLEVQGRMIAGLERLAAEHPDGAVAVVSHSDPIKSAIAHFAGMPLDLFLRLEINPASVSILTVNHWGPRIVTINYSDGMIPPA